MNMGDFRFRIALYYRREIEEVGGASTYPINTKIKDLWAKIEALTGIMRFDSKQIGEEITHKIWIRYYKGLSSQNWMKWVDPTNNMTRNFMIRNIRDINERHQYLELLVQEVFNDEFTFDAGIGEAGDPLEE